MSGMSERTNGGAYGPVLDFIVFLPNVQWYCHESTVESRYNGSKNNGNLSMIDAVFQSHERIFSLLLIMAIVEIRP